MSTNDPFVEAFHTLVGLFMTRSMRDMERCSRQHGFAPVHFRVLMHLHYRQPFNISDISDHLGITPAAASQLVQRLVEPGLIDRVEDPNDRRIKRISLTEAGESLVQEVIALRRQWMETVAAEFDPAERARMVEALFCLNNAIKKVETTFVD